MEKRINVRHRLNFAPSDDRKKAGTGQVTLVAPRPTGASQEPAMKTFPKLGQACHGIKVD